jgi:hypothetical protein
VPTLERGLNFTLTTTLGDLDLLEEPLTGRDAATGYPPPSTPPNAS